MLGKCIRLVKFICLCKVCEHSFHFNIRKFADSGNCLNTFFAYFESNSSHSCINFYVKKCGLSYDDCDNSAGIIDFPDMKHDLARAGISIYGMYPSDEVKKDAVDLKPALELISHISFVKDVEKGTSISYGGTFVAPKKMRIATIPVGYGDGYPRSLSNKGYVLIHGKRADIVGRVCMDQFMVDVTEIPEAKFMDPVTLVGKDKDAIIRVEDLSDLSGRFNYEFVCDLSKRVPREYYKNGTIVKQIDYFE